MKSPCCNEEFILRGKSKRKGELLLLCPNPECKNPKWQCREGKHSHPYQVKRRSEVETKTVNVRARITKSREKEILEKYESIQFFLDFGLVV